MIVNPKPNSQIVDEAAIWAEHLDHGELSAAERRALTDWLLKSPDHVNELLLATTVFCALGEVDKERKISIESLLENGASEVIALDTCSPELGALSKSKTTNTETPGWLWSGHKAPLIAVACALIAVLAATVLFLAPHSARNEVAGQVYATAIGEQRSFPLDDGSIVHLNTGSKIAIRFDNGKRDIDLVTGEVMFEVAHDPNRPFRVHAGDTIAEAVGTKFNVYRQDDRTTVSVLEGKVAIETARTGDIPGRMGEPPPADGQSTGLTSSASFQQRLMLVAGERASMDAGGEIQTTSLDNVEAVVSWRMRKLAFEREPLARIIHEYNRYNKMQIFIDDPGLAEFLFTGVFAIDDPNSLLSFLEISGLVKIDRSSQTEIHLKLSDRKDQ